MTRGGEGPWILHYHASSGYGDTFLRFRTKKEAKKYQDDSFFVGGVLTFYPIYKDGFKTWEQARQAEENNKQHKEKKDE